MLRSTPPQSTSAAIPRNAVLRTLATGRAGAVIVGFVAFLSSLAAPCHAVPVGGGGSATPIVVLVGDPAAQDDVRVLAEALGAQLADLDVSLTIRWVPSASDSEGEPVDVLGRVAAEEGVEAVLLCDPVTVDSLEVFVPSDDGGLRIRRPVTTVGLGDAGRLAAAAVITRAVVEAVLQQRPSVIGEGSESALESADVSAEAAAPPVEIANRKGPGVSLGAGYGMRFFEARRPVVHMVAARVELAVSPRLSVTAGYSFGPGIQVVAEGASLDMTAHDVTLGVAVDRSFGRFSLGGELAALLGLQRWEAGAGTDGLQASPGETDATVGGLAEVRLGLQLTPWMKFVAGPGLRVLAVNQVYDVTEAGWRTTILAPRRVQPHLTARFHFALR